MKLNIGCGYNYLDGYVNLDSNVESAADRLMSAHRLAFKDGSVSEIIALQLVEHLGFFKTKYFLSECWRVLAPGGKLRLETPHIEKTLKLFLAGDCKAREAALGWIYGSETPGMNHLYCFPEDLLAELLEEAGFFIQKNEDFDFQPGRPALRMEALKKEGERPAFNAALRRRLLDRGLADFGPEEESAGLELVISRLSEAAGDAGRALEQALYSAPAALEYFLLTEENEERPSTQAAACARLAEWQVQGRLAAEFESAHKNGETAAFESARSLWGSILSAALSAGAPPPGLPPVQGAPKVFTPLSARAWLAKKRGLNLRSGREIL